MTVATRLQTSLILAMGLQSDLLMQAANEPDPNLQLLWREAASEVAAVAKTIQSRLRELVVREPQYSSVEQIVDLWDSPDSRGGPKHGLGPH